MDEEQPNFKVVDRRPFNPDGTPREVPPEEKAEPATTPEAANTEPAPVTASNAAEETTRENAAPEPAPSRTRIEPIEEPIGSGDPLDDPASFLSLVMSLASNAAASLGMMPHPVSGESGVDLQTAKHWIDVLGMLEKKTSGNLSPQEAQVVEGLLADLRMQFVSLQSAPTPPPTTFSAADITGGK